MAHLGRISRRMFLAGACHAVATTALVPTLSFAKAPGECRFISIVLRGAMDGLDILQPYGDPNFSKLRPSLAQTPQTGLLDLDGYFGLHPALEPLKDWWVRRELGFIQAVSTPYRDVRSHFDGQDFLETGGAEASNLPRDGWLNRCLSILPNRPGKQFSLDVGRSPNLILQGDAETSSWSPETDMRQDAGHYAHLERLYAHDDLFHKAFSVAQATDAEVDAIEGLERNRLSTSIAHLTGHMLRREARIAAFSMSGWDTHARQGRILKYRLGQLADMLVALREALGADVWAQTAVVAMTEFGRTVRENGTGGTDHGTGAVAVLAGGAIRGGQIFGLWPGLRDDQLYQDRDLMPTDDIRRYAAWMLRDLFSVSLTSLETVVFPGMQLGTNPKIIA